eukprot:EG_transcript_18477
MAQYWVKLESYPWWPAKEVAGADIPAEVLAAKADYAGRETCVRFYGEANYAWVAKADPKQTLPLEFQSSKAQKGTKQLQRAIALARKDAGGPGAIPPARPPAKRKPEPAPAPAARASGGAAGLVDDEDAVERAAPPKRARREPLPEPEARADLQLEPANPPKDVAAEGEPKKPKKKLSMDTLEFAARKLDELLEGGESSEDESSQSSSSSSASSEDETPCAACGRAEDAASILLCDQCEAHYHLGCLSPPLRRVPEGDWFCPRCAPKRRPAAIGSRKRTVKRVVAEDPEDEAEETTPPPTKPLGPGDRSPAKPTGRSRGASRRCAGDEAEGPPPPTRTAP